MTRPRSRLRVGAASLMGAGIACLLAEGLLRVHNPLPSSVVRNRVVLHVNNRIEVPHEDGRTTLFTTNSLGFRGPEPPSDFAEALTMVAVGGSTTEGFVSDDASTWPHQLGDLLRSEFPSIWVNNAGISGHSTRGHLILLDDYLAVLKPKIAVFLVGINDIGNTDEPSAFEPSYNFLYNVTDPGWRQWLITLAFRSEVIQAAVTVNRRLRATRLGVVYDEGLDLHRVPERVISADAIRARVEDTRTRLIPPYVRRLEFLLARTRSLGIWPIVVTQPVLYGAGRDPVTGVRLDTLKVGGESNGLEMAAVIAEYNRALLATAKQHGILAVDLARQMPRRSDLYVDFIHFNDAGNARVASIVSDAITPALLDTFSTFARDAARDTQR